MRFQRKRIGLDEALENTKHTNVFSKSRLIIFTLAKRNYIKTEQQLYLNIQKILRVAWNGYILHFHQADPSFQFQDNKKQFS